MGVLRKLIDVVFGSLSLVLFLGAFFEDGHRTFEGASLTAAITTGVTAACLLFIGLLKLAGLETGGVYGAAHPFIEKLHETPWAPVSRIMCLPLALGLGSLLGGVLRGGPFSTAGFAIAVAAFSGVLLVRRFSRRFLRKKFAR